MTLQEYLKRILTNMFYRALPVAELLDACLLSWIYFLTLIETFGLDYNSHNGLKSFQKEHLYFIPM